MGWLWAEGAPGTVPKTNFYKGSVHRKCFVVTAEVTKQKLGIFSGDCQSIKEDQIE